MISSQNNEWIHTHCGIKFIHSAPKVEDILIEDIAHSLSHLCRFAGHVKTFYSVGEHSVRVSYACKPPFELEGLLHDGSEAYCIDMPRPLKYSVGMEAYRHYEKLADSVVRKAFGLLEVEPVEVKEADIRLLYTEKRDLLSSGAAWALPKTPCNLDVATTPLPETIVPWTSDEAKRRFLFRFYELTGRTQFYATT